MNISRWYLALLLACALIAFYGGFSYYVTYYRVWHDLAAEGTALADEEQRNEGSPR